MLTQFFNKGIESKIVPNIFKDESVISSIPDYFGNKKSPIIDYTYNKRIHTTIFNIYTLVNAFGFEATIHDFSRM